MATRKRQLIEPHEDDKRYVRRHRRSKSKTVAKPGQRDRGDRQPRTH